MFTPLPCLKELSTHFLWLEENHENSISVLSEYSGNRLSSSNMVSYGLCVDWPWDLLRISGSCNWIWQLALCLRMEVDVGIERLAPCLGLETRKHMTKMKFI
jgi:hypothetical protein